MLKAAILFSFTLVTGFVLGSSLHVIETVEEQVTPDTRQVIVTIAEFGMASDVFTIPMTGLDRCGEIEERLPDRSNKISVCSEGDDLYRVGVTRLTNVHERHVERRFEGRVRVRNGEMIDLAGAKRGRSGLSATLAVR